MKTKTKKGKAIIGIALAAIMLASVLVAMVPTGSATDPDNDGDNDIRAATGLKSHKVLLGQMLDFGAVAGGASIIGDPTSDNDDVKNFVDSVGADGTFDSSIFPDAGKYLVDLTGGDADGDGDSYNDAADADLSVSTPRLEIELADPTTGAEITSTVEGGFIVIDMTSNLEGEDLVDIKLTDPDGNSLKVGGAGSTDGAGVATTSLEGIPFNDLADADFDGDRGVADGFRLDTSGFKLGTYTIYVTTDSANDYRDAQGLELKSEEKTFEVLKMDVDISASEDELSIGEDTTLTITGPPHAAIRLTVTNPEDVRLSVEYKDGPGLALDANGDYIADVGAVDTDGDGYAGTPATGMPAVTQPLNENGIRKFVVRFLDDWTYTFTVTCDVDADNVIGDADDLDEDMDIDVSEATVTFDIPGTVIIGEELTIKGGISAGDRVDILIDNGDVAYFDGECVDENNEFEVKLDTEGLTPGSYTIDVYIDCPYSSYDEIETAGIDEDGTITIRLIASKLTAEQPRNVVAEGDDYTIEGTATGTDEVDIVLVGPEGYPAADLGLGVLNGLEITSSSVTYDDEFSEDITMKDGVDIGTWETMVYSPGRDGTYGNTWLPAGALDCIGTAVFAGKTQSQIVAILKDFTVDEVGSDDLLVSFTFEVETPYVRFDPIESVTIGEPLKITGKTNRESGTPIALWTIEGPKELPHVITNVEWPTPYQGIFNATINTSDAVLGTYTLEANDGDGNNDTVTVEILPAISIFDTGAGTYPSIFGTHNGTITPYYDLNVSKIYTYPCTGTGGHTEYVAFYNVTTGAEIANGTWNGYQGAGDYHYIEFDSPFILQAKVTYNYTIRTGSYPQIIHEPGKEVTGGVINCTEFTDANGKKYNNWIPAIRLE